MGWYTTGTSGFEFKYGNVHALARDCGLGNFSIAPRLRIELEDGEEFYEFEFLSDYQQELEKLRLPWKHLDFEDDFISVSPQESFSDYSFRIQEWISPYLTSIANMMLTYGVEKENSIQTIRSSFDCHWNLEKEEWPTFLSWINQHLASPLSMDDVSRGECKEGYSLPEDKKYVLENASEVVLLGLLVLGTAVVQNDELYLYQPDDDSEAVIFSVE
jgi:hypothetical protein